MKQQNVKVLFGTKEWADCNENIIHGCSNNCLYCYAKEIAIRFGRSTPDSWKNERLNQEALNKKFRSSKKTVMFPSTHDITPEFLDESLFFIAKIVNAYDKVLIVSKPRLECIEKICDEFQNSKSKILFRFTIGSSNSETLKFWEPGASLFRERLESLKYAHDHGFATSVSCEPMLDGNIDDVINQVLPYVTDSIWIGTMNKAQARLKINGAWNDEVRQKLEELKATWTDEKIKNLCERYENTPTIKWKESISKIINEI